MAGGPQWQQIQAPGFADVSQILRNAAASWTEGFDTLGEGLGNAADNQRMRESNRILPQLAGVRNEADVAGFLNDLPGMINPNNMTPELAQAVAGLRGTAIDYEQGRASIGQTNASTAGLIGGERRQQGTWDRQVANEDGLAALSNVFMRMGIQSFNQEGVAIGSNGQPIMNAQGQPLTEAEATQVASAQLPAGALPSDPQARDIPVAANGGGGRMPVNSQGAFDGFMGTVRSGGLTNAYGLAAVAATVQHESGFDPANAERTWQDDSESGRPGRAGGYMSWNNDRLQAMQRFTGGDNSPQAQAAFFLQEDPALIARLNNAGSVEEATRIMNDAWRFAGYDREGGEAQARINTAQGMLGRFGANNGPTGDNGYRARIDLGAAGIPDNFDWSMGGTVRATQVQDLLNNTIDQATRGSDESRTARTDQQDYVDSLRQFNEDQITFEQGQDDRRIAEETRLRLEAERLETEKDSDKSAEEMEADRLAAERAVNEVMANSRPTSVDEASRLLAQSGLDADQMGIAQGMMGVLNTDSRYGVPTDLTAPVGGEQNSVVSTYQKLNENALYSDAITRVNARVSDIASDADPVLLLREAIPGIQMEDGEITTAIRDTVAAAARGPNGIRITPAQAASILAENEFMRGFVGGIFGAGSSGDLRVDSDAAGQMAQDYFSQDNQAMAAEAIAASRARGEGIQEIQSRLDAVTEEMRIQTGLYGEPDAELLGAEKELRAGLNTYERQNPVPSISTAPSSTNAFDTNGQAVPENSAVVGEAVLSPADSLEREAQRYQMYLAEIRVEGRFPELFEIISSPESTPEERNKAIADAALAIGQDTSLSEHEREVTIEGLSLMAQTGVSSDQVRNLP